MKSLGSKGFPHKKHPFFLYNPGENEAHAITWYATKEERDAAAEELVQDYIDEDGWWPEVDQIQVGEVTGSAQEVDVVLRPTDDELDEDGLDPEGYDWGDHDRKCNYRVLPVADKGGADRE